MVSMRLPQSSAHSFSARVFFATIVTVFITTLSFGAQGAPQQLTCTPSLLSFGTVPLGQTETQLLTLTNNGQTSVTISAMSSLRAAEFGLPQLSLPLTIGAGESLTFNVTFTPSATGWTGGNATISSNASNPTVQFQFGGTGLTSDPLTASPSIISFGPVAVGSSSTKTVVLSSNRTWKEKVDAFRATGSEFSVSAPATPLSLSGGQSLTLSVTFTPQSEGLVGGSVFVAGPQLNVPFTGTGVAPTPSSQLTVSPTALSFGNVAVGSTQTQAITMSASGSPVTVTADSSSNTQFVLSGAAFPFTIAPGQNMSFNVAFTPKSSGAASGSLSFASNAANSQIAASLSGTGTAVAASGQLSVSPATLSFGSVPVGTTQTQSITMSATGAAVTVSSDGSSNSQFVLNGATLPLTVAAGQSLSFNVAFTPTSSGAASASLSFISNASNSQTVESLSGTGTATQYSVSLSWNPSTGVTGYNVYRSTASNGSYAKINPSIDPNTTYSDTTVASGQVYYYEATSVNSSGQESAPSTPPVVASVP
jgi:hypothetical protein